MEVSDACMILAINKISSAPVFDKSTASFIGMLDYRDIVAQVLMVLHKIPSPPKPIDAEWVFKAGF